MVPPDDEAPTQPIATWSAPEPDPAPTPPSTGLTAPAGLPPAPPVLPPEVPAPAARQPSARRAAVLGAVLSFMVLDVYDAYLNPPAHQTTITSCQVVGSRAIASGRLANLGDDTSDFTVLVGFVRPGTDNPHRTSRITLDDVEPGASAAFDAERQVELDEVDCLVIEVTGPLPFGLALD